MCTPVPNNVCTQHVAFCIGRKHKGQNYGISFIHSLLIYHSKFWENDVFLITHPCETEINHQVQSHKPCFLRKSNDKVPWFTCFWNSHSIYVSGFSVHSCQHRHRNIHFKTRGLEFWSHQKPQSFINTNENTALWKQSKYLKW